MLFVLIMVYGFLKDETCKILRGGGWGEGVPESSPAIQVDWGSKQDGKLSITLHFLTTKKSKLNLVQPQIHLKTVLEINHNNKSGSTTLIVLLGG